MSQKLNVRKSPQPVSNLLTTDNCALNLACVVDLDHCRVAQSREYAYVPLPTVPADAVLV